MRALDFCSSQEGHMIDLLVLWHQGEGAALTSALDGRLSLAQQQAVLANRCLLLLLLGRKDACKSAIAAFAKR